MPDMFNFPSVIPDVINRESMVFPCRHTQIRNQKNTGFPLTTGGYDRGGPGGYDKPRVREAVPNYPTPPGPRPGRFPQHFRPHVALAPAYPARRCQRPPGPQRL